MGAYPGVGTCPGHYGNQMFRHSHLVIPLGHTHFGRKYWSGHGLTGLSGCYAPGVLLANGSCRLLSAWRISTFYLITLYNIYLPLPHNNYCNSVGDFSSCMCQDQHLHGKINVHVVHKQLIVITNLQSTVTLACVCHNYHYVHMHNNIIVVISFSDPYCINMCTNKITINSIHPNSVKIYTLTNRGQLRI